MNTYTYFDYNKNRETVFVCEAVSILEADKKLFEVTGIEASKNGNIGCNPEVKPSLDGPKMR